MLFDIQRFFLFNAKRIEYSFKVYFQNLEVRYIFSKQTFLKTFPVSIFYCVVILFICYLAVWTVVFIFKNEDRGAHKQTVIKQEVVDRARNIAEKKDLLTASIDKSNNQEEEDVAPEDITAFNAEIDIAIRYIIAIDKNKKLLFVLNKKLEIVERVNVLLGANKGDKMLEGDRKTPAGVYKIVEIKEEDELLPMYGPYAYVLNYPNEQDKKNGKTGSGIWIHGTGKESRPSNTKGCVVADDNFIIMLSQYIHRDTEVYIFPDDYAIPLEGKKVPSEIISPFFLYGIIDNPILSGSEHAKS